MSQDKSAGNSDPAVTNSETANPERPAPGPGAGILRQIAEQERAERAAKEPKAPGVNKQAQLEELIRLAAEDNGTFQALVGRKPLPEPRKPTVEEEVNTLRSRLEAREAAEREQLTKSQLREAEDAIIEFVREKSESFPLLNALNMQAAVFDRLQAAYAEGYEISEVEAAGEIEAALVKQITDLAKVPLVVEKVLELHGGAKIRSPKADKAPSTAGEDEVSTTVGKKRSAKSKTLTSQMNSSVPRTDERPKPGSQSHRSKVADILQKFGQR